MLYTKYRIVLIQEAGDEETSHYEIERKFLDLFWVSLSDSDTPILLSQPLKFSSISDAERHYRKHIAKKEKRVIKDL